MFCNYYVDLTETKLLNSTRSRTCNLHSSISSIPSGINSCRAQREDHA